MTYSGVAAPANAVLSETDLTTVVGGGGLTLTKQVQNVTLASAYGTTDIAAPGQTLQYAITRLNQGSTSISTVVFYDATPAFTTFVSASCPGAAALPAGLTGCSVSTAPATGGTGNLQWVFVGSLAPGAQTAVTFQVQVAP